MNQLERVLHPQREESAWSGGKLHPDATESPAMSDGELLDA